MHLIRRALTILLLAALLLPAIPARAADNTMYYSFEGPAALALGETFALQMKLKTQEPTSFFRVYVLYDKLRLRYDSFERKGVLAGGMFGLREADGEAEKYPRGMTAAQRAGVGVLVVQWAAAPAGGALPVVEADAAQSYLTLQFTLRGDAPGGSGAVWLSDDYADPDLPYFDESRPRDLSAARYSVTAGPPPQLQILNSDIVVDNTHNYIYGFPRHYTQTGGVTPWSDEYLTQYLAASNGGSLVIDNSQKPENKGRTGTGSRVLLMGAGQMQQYGAYTLVVFGDLDGNFLVDLDDWAELKAMLAGKRPQKLPSGSTDVYDTPWHLAADVEGAVGVLNSADLQALYEAALGRAPLGR
ncbi:MAG: hypothetical protein LBG83_00300 [Oscillospiraceae bacterium]|jgi:hypothetical protein|nr:hypothetical protein [Oscillospiraceae bacterium]